MSATFTAFRALVRKDIAMFLRDRRALVVNVLTPIVVAAFFGFLFGGTGSGGNPISRMKVAVTDLDDSALTKAVLESLSQDAVPRHPRACRRIKRCSWCAAANCAPPSSSQPISSAAATGALIGQRPYAGREAAL